MKAIIKSIKGDNSNFDMSVDYFDDQGSLSLSKVIGVFLDKELADSTEAIDYIRTLIINNFEKHEQAQGSILKPEADKLVGLGIDF